MVLNNVTKFHKVMIQNTGLIHGTPLKKIVNFHKQRAITPDGMLRYGPLLNLKTWY